MKLTFNFFSLQQSSAQNADPSHTQRWHSIEIVKGTYGPEDCVNDIAEIKFDKPIPIKVNIFLYNAKCILLVFAHLMRKKNLKFRISIEIVQVYTFHNV